MISDELKVEMLAHAAECKPFESCGLIAVVKGREKYFPCKNLQTGPSHFQIDGKDYADVEDKGVILKIVHSHVYESPDPSQADLIECEKSELPWVIINWPVGTVVEFEPTGYVAPLVGRVFSHGVLDCYTLIRDYYARELNIVIPDFSRPDEWWKTEKDLYRQNFEEAGFVRISEKELQPHDVILMQLGSDKTNHGAIYLGDSLILHHPMQRLSGRDAYGGYWHKISTHFLRHRSRP